MKSYIYATVVCYIVLLAEHVFVLRSDYYVANVLAAFAVIFLTLLAMMMWEERNVQLHYKLNCVDLWNRDFK